MSDFNVKRSIHNYAQVYSKVRKCMSYKLAGKLKSTVSTIWKKNLESSELWNSFNGSQLLI